MDIIIISEPEMINGKPMYFWFLCKKGSNHGHGWAESILQAAIDAEILLNKIKDNE